jgi:Spy/CpxP family protein refolding chaperone
MNRVICEDGLSASIICLLAAVANAYMAFSSIASRQPLPALQIEPALTDVGTVLQDGINLKLNLVNTSKQQIWTRPRIACAGLRVGLMV